MAEKEKIPPSVEGPITPPPRRVDHLEKARRLRDQAQAGAGGEEQPQPAQPDSEGLAARTPEERPTATGSALADGPAVKKLTTRIPVEQFAWLTEQTKEYRKRNPRAPRLTIEGLIMVAIDNLKEAKNLDAVITKYRS